MSARLIARGALAALVAGALAACSTETDSEQSGPRRGVLLRTYP